MTTFTAPIDLGGSGTVYDSADMEDYGYLDPTTGFFAILDDVTALAQGTADNADLAQTAADIAINAPAAHATSVTSNSLANSGDKTFAVAAAGPWAPHQRVRCGQTSDLTKWMDGHVKTYSGTSLVITMDSYSGAAGPFTDWTIVMVAESAAGMSTSWTLTAAGLVTGGGDGSANRTVTVTAAVAAGLWAASSATTAVTPDAFGDAQVSTNVTDAATITLDGDAGWNFHVTAMAGNRTIANPSNFKSGQSGYIVIGQDSTGNRVPVWGSNWKKPAGFALSTAANATDVITYYVFAPTFIVLGIVKGLS